MSTDTYAPTLGAADSLAAAQTIRDKAVAAAAWPISLAKRILNALRGGWTEAFKGVKSTKTFLANTVSAIPASVKGFLISAPFSTEGGYERMRNVAYQLANKAISGASLAAGFVITATGIAFAAPAFLVSLFNKDAATTITDGILIASKKAYNVITMANQAARAAVDYLYYTFGHRVAVRTVTTGATGISALVAAEALSILGVNMGMLPTTLSGFIAGSPLLSGLPLVPAMLTSAGVVAVAIAALVVVGGATAWLFNRAEINTMIKEDQAFAAETAAKGDVTVDATVVKAEVEQLIAEATEAKVQADIAREVINQSRHGGGKRHNK